MSTIFRPAPDEATAMLKEVMEEHRRDLVKHEVNICLLFAHSDKVGVPALRHRGSRVAGWCRPNSYAERVEGKADATICLDGDCWPRWSDRRRRALIHHELLHLAYCDGKADDLGRPRLSSQRGDWNHDGFYDVLRIYGTDSFEYSNLHTIARGPGQPTLPFMAEATGFNPLPGDDAPASADDQAA